jgi:flagellar protein FlbD
MIELRKWNGQVFFINCDLIQFIEQAPDTLLTLTTGEKIRILETPEEVIDKTVRYRLKLKQPEWVQ